MKTIHKRLLSLSLAFTIAFPATLFAQSGTKQIKSNYLKNGVVYWDDSWNTETKNQQHQQNLNKVESLFGHVRIPLTCGEKNLTVQEKYLCGVYKIKNPNVQQASFGIFSVFISLGTIVGLMFSSIGLDSLFAFPNESLGKMKFSALDQTILDSRDNFTDYLAFTEGHRVYNGDVDQLSQSFETFLEKAGLDIKTVNYKPRREYQNGKEIYAGKTAVNLQISRKLAGANAESFVLSEDLALQFLRELSNAPTALYPQYVDGLFKFKADFLREDPVKNADEILTYRKALGKTLEETIESKIQNLPREDFKKQFKWKESARYRTTTHLVVAGGILAIAAGFIYWIERDNGKWYGDANEIDDLPSLFGVLNQSPELAAVLAMQNDEIIQSAADMAYIKSHIQ